MPVYELHLSDQQETRLSHFLSFRFVWDTPFCQKTADMGKVLGFKMSNLVFCYPR